MMVQFIKVNVSYHFKYRWRKTAQYYDIECLYLTLLAVNIFEYFIIFDTLFDISNDNNKLSNGWFDYQYV